jgi:hypothetical protein
LSTKSNETVDSGDTGDKSSIVLEEGKDKDHSKEYQSSNIEALIDLGTILLL